MLFLVGCSMFDVCCAVLLFVVCCSCLLLFDVCCCWLLCVAVRVLSYVVWCSLFGVRCLKFVVMLFAAGVVVCCLLWFVRVVVCYPLFVVLVFDV